MKITGKRFDAKLPAGKHTRLKLPTGKHTRLSAPYPRHQLVSAPVQAHPLTTVHPLSTAPTHPTQAHALKPAQTCIHAYQLVSTPAQVHPLSTVPTPPIPSTPVQAHPLRPVSTPANWKAHPLKRTRSALHRTPQIGKHTSSSAPAQNCIQASNW